jgi:DNA-binding transcriptional LysR family regulator
MCEQLSALLSQSHPHTLSKTSLDEERLIKFDITSTCYNLMAKLEFDNFIWKPGHTLRVSYAHALTSRIEDVRGMGVTPSWILNK